ncbi:MAG: peptide chain release factor 1 [Firmicutes bacterium]|nr:peptide chain release factor 1 [Bacillota bacterium]
MLDKLLSIEKKYEELNNLLCQENVIANPQEYKRVAKERAGMEDIVSLIREYKKLLFDFEEANKMEKAEKDPEFSEFLSQEVKSLTERKEKMEDDLTVLLLPRDPFADKNIIMEIRAGAGGDEAALFGMELFRMYNKYAENKGWKTEVLSSNITGLGGLKEVIFSIEGKEVYSRLKFESGVHRVQRVPATEASGRIHTSTVTVAVLPEAEEFDVEINPVDLRVDTYRSSGAGGQHVNKTDSAVRITHMPTNLVVACQDERSQHQNREKAMRILRAKLYEMKQEEEARKIAQSRKLQVGTGDRSEKIRTYNFPQSRITDHRIGLSVHNMEKFLLGEIDEMVDALMMAEQREMLQKVS